MQDSCCGRLPFAVFLFPSPPFDAWQQLRASTVRSFPFPFAAFRCRIANAGIYRSQFPFFIASNIHYYNTSSFRFKTGIMISVIISFPFSFAAFRCLAAAAGIYRSQFPFFLRRRRKIISGVDKCLTENTLPDTEKGNVFLRFPLSGGMI